MEVLANSSDVNTTGSTFSSVHGHQVNVNYNGPTTVYSFSLFGSGCASHFPRGNLPRLVTDTETQPQRSPLTACRSADPISVIKEAIVLIDHISKSLVDPSDLSNSHCDLQLVLETLRQVLRLAKCAIRAYEDKPLGRSLAYAIASEVEGCCMLLWELHGRIRDTWVLLICTRISSLWRQVLRNQWDGDELASLKRRLYARRNSLGTFMLALNSYAIFLWCITTD